MRRAEPLQEAVRAVEFPPLGRGEQVEEAPAAWTDKLQDPRGRRPGAGEPDAREMSAQVAGRPVLVHALFEPIRRDVMEAGWVGGPHGPPVGPGAEAAGRRASPPCRSGVGLGAIRGAPDKSLPGAGTGSLGPFMDPAMSARGARNPASPTQAKGRMGHLP
jgi:hypothetical protein